MPVPGPCVDLLPLTPQSVLHADRRAVRPPLDLAVGALDISAQVGIRLENAGRLSTALIVGPLVLLGRTGRGQGVRGPPQNRYPFQAVPCGPLVVADILLGEHHGLPGQWMGDGVPDLPGLVLPWLHQVPGHWDQFRHPSGSRAPNDPVVGVAALIAAVLQHLFADAGCHGLVGPDVKHMEQRVRRPLPGTAVEDVVGQLGHGAGQNAHTPVHGGELPGEGLRVLCGRRIAGGHQRRCRQRFGPGGGSRQAG